LHGSTPTDAAAIVRVPADATIAGRDAVLVLKAIAVWGVILVCAIANGALREAVLVPRFGPAASLVLSGLLLCTCIVVLAFGLVPRLGPTTVRARAGIGVLWLALTLAFEFGFGRFVQQRSWESLFDAYTFKDGNLWPLVLLATLLSPVLAPARKGSR
jgi:hypothetical protein